MASYFIVSQGRSFCWNAPQKAATAEGQTSLIVVKFSFAFREVVNRY